VATVVALAVAIGTGCRAAPGVERAADVRPAAAPAVRPARADAVRPSRSVTVLERRIFALVNEHRQRLRLAPLVLDARMSDEARRHSVAMAAGWTPPGHRGFRERVAALRRSMPIGTAAENVAAIRDYDDAAVEAMRGWLASTGHRESIEGPYERTGIGVASNAAGEFYFTQLFAAR
jgi:uncharacterized protein YkwD